MPLDIDRRRFFETATFVMAGLALASETVSSVANAQSAQPSGMSPMTYETKPLPFDPIRAGYMSGCRRHIFRSKAEADLCQLRRRIDRRFPA
jgi:hypothetical protein